MIELPPASAGGVQSAKVDGQGHFSLGGYYRSFQYHRSYTDRRWRQHQRISGAQHNACGNFWIVAKAIKVLRTMSRAADFLAARLLSIISASLGAKMKGLA